MATKKTPGSTQSKRVTSPNGRGGPSRPGAKRSSGQRGSQREVVVVQKGSSTAMWAVVIAVVVVGVFVGTLLIIDIVQRGKSQNATGSSATTQGQQEQGPTIPQLEQLVKQQPNNTQARLELGHAYLDARDATKARIQYTAVLKSDPNNSEGLNHMGLIKVADGSGKDALSYYDRALAAKPTNPAHVLWDKASLLMELKRYNEAIPVWQQIIALPNIKGTTDGQNAQQALEQAQKLAGQGK